jgi:drug/metabolite transporter (DMT)-like permease
MIWSDNARGAVLMMGAMAAFTINDAFIKAVGAAVPLAQILVIRGALTTVLVAGLAVTLGALDLRLGRRDAGLVILRSASEVAAAFFFLTALRNLPFANVTAILQVLPLTVTLGAALVFGERVGWRRYLAILVGFLGMLLIVRPSPAGFDPYAGYALAAVLCVTLRDLSTRRMSERVPSLTVTFAASLSVTLVFGAASLGIDWVPLGWRDAGLIGGSVLFISAAYLLSVLVMRAGEISAIAPFRYSGLIWALCLGLSSSRNGPIRSRFWGRR